MQHVKNLFCLFFKITCKTSKKVPIILLGAKEQSGNNLNVLYWPCIHPASRWFCRGGGGISLPSVRVIYRHVYRCLSDDPFHCLSLLVPKWISSGQIDGCLPGSGHFIEVAHHCKPSILPKASKGTQMAMACFGIEQLFFLNHFFQHIWWRPCLAIIAAEFVFCSVLIKCVASKKTTCIGNNLYPLNWSFSDSSSWSNSPYEFMLHSSLIFHSVSQLLTLKCVYFNKVKINELLRLKQMCKYCETRVHRLTETQWFPFNYQIMMRRLLRFSHFCLPDAAAKQCWFGKTLQPTCATGAPWGTLALFWIPSALDDTQIHLAMTSAWRAAADGGRFIPFNWHTPMVMSLLSCSMAVTRGLCRESPPGTSFLPVRVQAFILLPNLFLMPCVLWLHVLSPLAAGALAAR